MVTGGRAETRLVVVRGRLVIALIVLLGLSAAGFAWWFRWRQGHRAVALWGGEAAALLVRAPRVTALQLGEPPGSAGADDPCLEIDSRRWPIRRRRPLETAPGVVHARQALVEDASYDWTSPAPRCVRHWDYALEFGDGSRRRTLVLDLQCRRARLLPGSVEADISPIASGMRTFLEEQFAGDGR